MKQERNALKAGIFIVVSIALAGGIIVGIQGIRSLWQPMQTRRVAFDLKDDIGGLQVGDDVRIGGYRVGEVTEIGLEAFAAPQGRSAHRLVVTFNLPKKYVLGQGAQLNIGQGLTGTAWLNFDSLGGPTPLPQTAMLQGGPSSLTTLNHAIAGIAGPARQIMSDLHRTTLPHVNSILANVEQNTVPGVNAAVGKFSRTADSFTQTGKTATELVTNLKGQVSPVVGKYHKVADAAIQMLDSVAALFGGIKTDFRGTVANLNAVTGDLRKKMPGLLEKVDGILAGINRNMDRFTQTMTDIRSAAGDAKSMTAAARSVIADNRSRIDGMIESMKATSDNLKGASAEIRRSPWRLLYKPRPGEMENLNVFDSARAFSDGANDLNDAAGALRDALNDPHADKARLKKLMDRLNGSFTHFKEVEQTLWKSVQE